MVDSFEGRESVRTAQTLPPPPDRGAVFGDSRVDDLAVVVTA